MATHLNEMKISSLLEHYVISNSFIQKYIYADAMLQHLLKWLCSPRSKLHAQSHVCILVGIGIHQLVVAQSNVHGRVAEEVIEMANDQAEALSSDKEVTDECLDDEQVGESRPSKRIRVTQEEMVKDEKPKKS
nr:hypothetical protein [Tanacetum cinerariifolium]